MTKTLTPADIGTIAACMDDAMSLRLGDDGTCDAAATDIAHHLRIDVKAAWSLAYAEMRRRFGR